MEPMRPAHLRPRPTARPRPPAPKRSSTPWFWILLLIPVGLVFSLGAIIGLGALFNLTGSSVALADSERELIVDISHLTGWIPDYSPDFTGESLKKTRYIDDSYEIEYTYELPDDDEAPYLSYTLTFEPSEGDAGTTYTALWGGTKIGFAIFGEVEVEVKEQNEIFRWGDDSRFALLYASGQPFGNVFVARKGKRVVYLLVSGIYFDESESFSSFLSPYLEKLDAFPVES